MARTANEAGVVAALKRIQQPSLLPVVLARQAILTQRRIGAIKMDKEAISFLGQMVAQDDTEALKKCAFA